jgi:hypothetical protein
MRKEMKMEKIRQEELDDLRFKMKVNLDGIVNRCFSELPKNNSLTKRDIYDELKMKMNYEINNYLGYQLFY